ncbi:unnamed protein product, partial [Closterium sp. Naga37s-1]
SGNVSSGSPVSTPPTRSRSRSLAALAAVMGGGKAGGANFCGGARWHAMWSAALVLLTIVGIMTWESFHANHRTKWWRRNQLVILENASISSSSYNHSSSAYNHGNSLRSQQGGSNSEAGVEQSARSPLRADSVLVLASGLREGLASPPGEKIGGSEAGDFSGGDNNGSDASGGDGGTGDTEASDSLESGVDKGGKEMSGGGKGGGNEMKEVVLEGSNEAFSTAGSSTSVRSSSSDPSSSFAPSDSTHSSSSSSPSSPSSPSSASSPVVTSAPYTSSAVPAVPAVPAAPLCDLYHGRWVRARQRALYSGKKCKWISLNWACARSNRPREMRQYERLRWQPRGCNAKRFSADGFFRRMRNKSLAFVGDSLGQQQFQSLLCLLSPKGPPKNMSDPSSPIQDVGPDYGFFQLPGARRPTGWAYRFVKYNTTVIFRWTTCLCEIEPFNKEDWKKGQAMHLDRPDTFLRDFLKELDVVVLNTGHHWNRGKMKESALEFFLNGSKAPPVRKRPMVMALALKTAIRSVSVWIDEQLKGSGGEGGLLVKPGEGEGEGGEEGEGEGGGEGLRRSLGTAVELPAFAAGGGAKLRTAIFATPDTKPMVFLRSITPRHFMEGEWDSGGRCDHLKHPLGDVEVANMTTRDAEKEDGVLGTSVHLLNITHLSAYRGDAHPAIWDPRSNTPKGQDCLHWCLPGVPDTWNELVYTHIVERERLEKQNLNAM